MSKSRKPSVRILFIGNSFTQRNDLPDLIAQLASALGLTIEHKLLSIGGASLRTHWNKGDALALIKSSKFKYVVLQEQSTLPIKNAARMRENVLLFDEAIGSAGAKTVLYMTWARKNTPELERVITNAYESIGREIDAVVVPVGVAWQHFMSQHELPVLHDRDQSHPTVAGSYLAACVFLSALFGESSVGIKSKLPALSDDQVRSLQLAAEDTVAG